MKLGVRSGSLHMSRQLSWIFPWSLNLSIIFWLLCDSSLVPSPFVLDICVFVYTIICIISLLLPVLRQALIVNSVFLAWKRRFSSLLSLLDLSHSVRKCSIVFYFQQSRHIGFSMGRARDPVLASTKYRFRDLHVFCDLPFHVGFCEHCVSTSTVGTIFPFFFPFCDSKFLYYAFIFIFFRVMTIQ